MSPEQVSTLLINVIAVLVVALIVGSVRSFWRRQIRTGSRVAGGDIHLRREIFNDAQELAYGGIVDVGQQVLILGIAQYLCDCVDYDGLFDNGTVNRLRELVETDGGMDEAVSEWLELCVARLLLFHHHDKKWLPLPGDKPVETAQLMAVAAE